VPFFEMLKIKMYANVTNEQKRAISTHREEVFSALYDETGTLLTCRQTGSCVLFRAEIALVLQSFATHTALIVLAVWRRIGRDAILRGRVRRLFRAALAGGRSGVALRVARGTSQCWMSHDRCLHGKRAAIETASIQCRVRDGKLPVKDAPAL
jgi:hypothetical protein